MNNLGTALQLDLFKELDSLPTEFEEYEHSEKYNKNINRLFDKMRGDKYHRFTKKATTIILVAAILFALVVAGFAATVGREFVIKTFCDHFAYSVVDKEGKKTVTELNVGYIPAGFTLESESGNAKTLMQKRFVNGNLYIDVDKRALSTTVEYDSKTTQEYVEIDGITYVYFGDPEYGLNGILWNKNGYIYCIQGNIKKDELLEIAKQVV
ncbi:MAG: DUF4367 domain-containing protein [Clostridia bacterium]|nr:DUF4367 domain-containing protein [Clostridia bacterium]